MSWKDSVREMAMSGMGIGMAAGGAASWLTGGSLPGGMALGAGAGYGLGRYGAGMAGDLANFGASTAQKYMNNDNADWMNSSVMPNLMRMQDFAQNSTADSRRALSATGAALAGGMFAPASNHKRRASPYNRNRGNYIGA